MELKEEHIIAYIEGRLTEKEINEIQEILASSPELRHTMDEYEYIWRLSGQVKKDMKHITDRNWNQLSSRIKSDRKKNNFFHTIRNIAAILLLPVLFSTIYLYVTKQEPRMMIETGDVEMIEVASAYGLVTQLSLPDGSVVTLNSGSKIIYPRSFNEAERTVRLVGEAYFNVTADKNHRFNVLLSDNVKVSAYGTEFNIFAYENESIIETTLVNGNVAITNSAFTADTRNMQPGELAVYNKQSGEVEVSEINVLVKTAWKDGKLLFRKAPMSEVVKRLSRHFNVEFRLLGEELRDYEYYATFTTESLQEVLLLLEQTAPIKCKIVEPEPDEDYSFTQKTVLITQIK